MELVFLVSSDGSNVKRGQTRRACDSCRHKKKRCYHNETEEQSIQNRSVDVSCPSNSQSPASQVSRRDPIIRSRSASPRRVPSNDPPAQNVTIQGAESINTSIEISVMEAEEETRRFACDSNPMVTLVEKNDSRLHKGKSQKGDVGAWMCPEEYTMEQEGDRAPSSPLHTAIGVHQQSTDVHPDGLPPKESQDALIDIYFRRIHPILPLLDESTVRAQFKAGKLSFRLAQAIFLVTAKDQSAASCLYLGQESKLLTLEEFSSILYNDLMRSIPRRSQRNVLTIQVLGLLSLHEWGSTGSEDCSLNLAQAIHHAQTMGLHLMRPDQHTHQSSKPIFWCLWSLDRWNAAMNGRSLMIHDGDMGQGVDDVVSSFQSPFRVWLRIANKLGEVIRFYRPMMKEMDEGEFDLPSFDELVEQCEAWDMAPDQLESLELAYHSVILLSTYSNGLQGRSPPRMSNIRQGHSIMTIASLSCNQEIRSFLPLPMIGYTISLAFSVTYKQLRASKLPSARKTAISKLRIFHQCLQKASNTWWSTAVMARLGQRVLNNIQPTIGQDRCTDQAIDITRSNPQHGLRHISTHPPDSSVNIQSHPTLETTERTEPRAESIYLSNNRQLGSTHLTQFDEIASAPLFSGTEMEDFDSFFDNFTDLNFPSCSNDQLLLDLDADFEFVPDSFY